MENGLLKKRAEEHMAVAGKIASDSKLISQVDIAAAKISDCYSNGGKTIFFGNGGSAADAQHMAAEFLGRYLKERKALPSVALSANSSATTAIGNDYGYERTFCRQLEAWGKKGDVAIGISTSGNSKNVVEAASYAHSHGIFMISLVGKNKCALDSLSDICIKVPSAETPRIQEMHELILHTICEMVENELIAKKVI